MNNTNHKIGVLILGGPLDGQMVAVDARQRTISMPILTDTLSSPVKGNMPTDVREQIFTINSILDVKGVHYVAQANLNACPIRTLIAGYRKPATNDPATDENMAEQLVTLLGGTHDGQQMVVPDMRAFCKKDPLDPNATRYQIMTLTAKDLRSYRVGVIDVMSVDPIELLIAGYRK